MQIAFKRNNQGCRQIVDVVKKIFKFTLVSSVWVSWYLEKASSPVARFSILLWASFILISHLHSTIIYTNKLINCSSIFPEMYLFTFFHPVTSLCKGPAAFRESVNSFLNESISGLLRFVNPLKISEFFFHKLDNYGILCSILMFSPIEIMIRLFLTIK